ncbi:winged helix-turn-helix transcriptional regulator [Pseudovibrio sp. SCP19]|uniref:winged helix-turn-helix transcriptional regulator n=1 Tax=Pseudovibrio sp. SCP19 TaxID=3141374 RepID=UPI00333639F1
MSIKLPANPYGAECPSRQLLEIIGGKWSLLILPALLDGPKRNSELMRKIEGISQKMLSQTLRSLEDAKLVHRHDYGEVPPRVDYRLTEHGKSLVGIVAQLDQWVIDHYETVIQREQN